MAKPVIKKDCKGNITAASDAPEYVGKPKIVKRICKENPLKNIVETLIDRGFTALVDAVKVAGLVDVLSDQKAVFTLFAPTNEAFTKVAETLKDKTSNDLVNILTYHLIDEKLLAKELDSDNDYETLNRFTDELGFVVDNDKLLILFNQNEKATVLQSDILASNGVIHTIDRVMVPRLLTIADIVERRDDLSTLKTALQEAGYLENLREANGAFSLFAPDDLAFSKVSKDDLDALLLNKDALQNVLLYHLAPEIDADDLIKGQKIKTNLGNKIIVDIVVDDDDGSGASPTEKSIFLASLRSFSSSCCHY